MSRRGGGGLAGGAARTESLLARLHAVGMNRLLDGEQEQQEQQQQHGGGGALDASASARGHDVICP
jgi:hypothetical protein